MKYKHIFLQVLFFVASFTLIACAPEQIILQKEQLSGNDKVLIAWHSNSRHVQIDEPDDPKWKNDPAYIAELDTWKKIITAKNLYPMIKQDYNPKASEYFQQFGLLPVTKKWPVDLKNFYHKKTRPLKSTPDNFFGKNVSIFKTSHNADLICFLDITSFGIFENKTQETYSLKLSMELIIIHTQTSAVIGKESIGITHLLSKKYQGTEHLEGLLDIIDASFQEGIDALFSRLPR